MKEEGEKVQHGGPSLGPMGPGAADLKLSCHKRPRLPKIWPSGPKSTEVL